MGFHPTSTHTSDMSDGPRMGWYDLSMARGNQDFQVDFKAEIKWDYRGDIRE